VRYSSIADLSSIKKRNSNLSVRQSGGEILKMLDQAIQVGQDKSRSSSHNQLDKTEVFIYQEASVDREGR